ncbi:MAG: rod shape-determining protein RodA [Treponema sp.]|nr:rod shape-determining protein RodA [Treponema sp.]
MKIRDFLAIDYLVLLPVITLIVMGIMFIYSSGINAEGVIVSTEYVRQIVWASLGLVIALTLAMTNYRRFYNISMYVYLFSLIPLVYTIVFNQMVQNARWIRIGIFGLQASEFVKITTIVFLARYLADTQRAPRTFLRFIVSCAIVLIPMMLILVQPDLGTALVYVPILIFMVFVAGLSMRYVIFLISSIALIGLLTVLPLWQTFILQRSLPILSILTNPRLILIVIMALGLIVVIALFGLRKFKKRYFFWIIYGVSIVILSLGASYAARGVLRNYQIMRLIVFLDPSVDPRGAGWNIIQSVTAIGAGGLSGQGFLQGTQSNYRYLPGQSTDFIFSIFSEEMGFVGGIIVFLLFLIICLRLLRIIKTTSDPYASYICAGLAGMFSFHFLINVGMTMGIMPVTGIPLVFMSYGGSSLISAMAGVGLALSIHVRRYFQ